MTKSEFVGGGFDQSASENRKNLLYFRCVVCVAGLGLVNFTRATLTLGLVSMEETSLCVQKCEGRSAAAEDRYHSPFLNVTCTGPSDAHTHIHLAD